MESRSVDLEKVCFAYTRMQKYAFWQSRSCIDNSWFMGIVSDACLWRGRTSLLWRDYPHSSDHSVCDMQAKYLYKISTLFERLNRGPRLRAIVSLSLFLAGAGTLIVVSH